MKMLHKRMDCSACLEIFTKDISLGTITIFIFEKRFDHNSGLMVNKQGILSVVALSLSYNFTIVHLLFIVCEKKNYSISLKTSS